MLSMIRESGMAEVDDRLYAALLSERVPRVIKTEAENSRALDEVEALMKRGDELSPAESDLLELLVILIESFEEERYGASTATPVDVLRELMAARGMKQSDIVSLFPSKGVASEVLSGKRGISKTQARKLGDYFHVPAAVFLGL